MPAPAAELNPYAGHLGDARPHDVLEMTALTIARLIRNCDAEQLTRAPAAGKWSIRDILCHLADTEITFAFRLRQTMSEPHHVIQPFDQDAWAQPYGKLDAHDALDAFTAIRRWNLSFIRAAGTARRVEAGAASGARRDDVQDHHRNDGWSRHQSPAADREAGLAATDYRSSTMCTSARTKSVLPTGTSTKPRAW